MRHIVVLALASLTLIACNRPDPQLATEARPAAVPETVVAPATNPDFPAGLEPPFTYKIRSRRTEDSPEGSVRKLVIEFKQGDTVTVDKQIEGLLAARGYRRYKSFEQGDDIVGDYGNHGHRVTVTTTPANSSGQQGLDPDSRGTVYFVWKE